MLSAVGLAQLVAVAAAAQGPLGASLVANTVARAETLDVTTGVVVASQTQPIGPLTMANLQVSMARYSCALSTATGVRLTATSHCDFLSWPFGGRTHADLSLVVTGSGHATIMLDLAHLGDSANGWPFRIDVGDDGTPEIDSGCLGSSCTMPHHHRYWTWDFGNGDLVVRILTDQSTQGGPQDHTLELDVVPWSPHASPFVDGCGGVAAVTHPFTQFHETMNYGLAALPASNSSQLLELRAVGYGDFGFFVGSSSPAMMPLVLPAPLLVCPALAAPHFLAPGQVTKSTFGSGSQRQPREWRMDVPALIPGLVFVVQHGSFAPTAPQMLGTTNVIRVDT